MFVADLTISVVLGSPVDKPVASRIANLIASIDGPLGEIDEVISQIVDQTERRVWAEKLGNVLRVMNDEFIRPISREFPDLDPDQ